MRSRHLQQACHVQSTCPCVLTRREAFEQGGAPSSKVGIGLLFVSMGRESEPGTCCWAALSMKSKLGGAVPVNYSRLTPQKASLQQASSHLTPRSSKQITRLSHLSALRGKSSRHSKLASGSLAKSTRLAILLLGLIRPCQLKAYS